jgi:hypothetical protein
MSEAKKEATPEEQGASDGRPSCTYVGRFHERSSETYRKYKPISARFAEIAEHQVADE